MQRPPPQRLRPQQREAARHEQRGPDALARDVAHGKEEVTLVDEERLVEVAPHLRGRLHRRGAVDLRVVREDCRERRQHARLDLPRQPQLLPHLLPRGLALERRPEPGAHQAQQAAGKCGPRKQVAEHASLRHAKQLARLCRHHPGRRRPAVDHRHLAEALAGAEAAHRRGRLVEADLDGALQHEVERVVLLAGVQHDRAHSEAHAAARAEQRGLVLESEIPEVGRRRQ